MGRTWLQAAWMLDFRHVGRGSDLASCLDGKFNQATASFADLLEKISVRRQRLFAGGNRRPGSRLRVNSCVRESRTGAHVGLPLGKTQTSTCSMICDQDHERGCTQGILSTKVSSIFTIANE